MKTRLASAGAMLLSVGAIASAHRLDEYLLATTISIEKDRIQGQIHLTPGVAVFPVVLAGIDTDADGAISDIEQQRYAQRVLRDLSLAVDGKRLPLRLTSMQFGTPEQMREGLGEIQLDFDAGVPRVGGKRRLIFENHHQSAIAAYLINCLTPRDPDIQVQAQQRDYVQSFYQLDYAQRGGQLGLLSRIGWSEGGLLGGIALLLFARLAWLWRKQGPSQIEQY